jgi:hypothetical protein
LCCLFFYEDFFFSTDAPNLPLKALFTFRVFEGMRGDYFESRNFSSRLFTSLGFEGIIPRYPHKSPPPSVFLARLKTLHHGRVFF